MAKITPLKTSFNSGELSPRLAGRVDLDKYANGCSVMQNFVPLIQGPIERRPGTRFVATAKNQFENDRTYLAKFEYNYQQSFILEFGNYYVIHLGGSTATGLV